MKSSNSKICGECDKEFRQDPYEAHGTWKRRKTCGSYECKRARRVKTLRDLHQKRARHVDLNQTGR